MVHSSLSFRQRFPGLRGTRRPIVGKWCCLDAVVEFEADGALENDLIVVRRSAMHPGTVRVGPLREHLADELMEVVTVGRASSQTASRHPPVGGNAAEMVGRLPSSWNRPGSS